MPQRADVPPIGIETLETDPHTVLHDLRESGPVAWVEALDGWVVTGRSLAIEVMRDARTFTVDDPRFSTGQVIGPSMLSLDGAEQARHREPFGIAFRDHENRKRLTAFIDRTARSLVEQAASRDGRGTRQVPEGTAQSPRDAAPRHELLRFVILGRHHLQRSPRQGPPSADEVPRENRGYRSARPTMRRTRFPCRVRHLGL